MAKRLNRDHEMSEVRKISYIKIYIIWPSEMIKMGFPDMHAEHTVT